MNRHCCAKMEEMTAGECSVHAERFECPDALLHYSPQSGEYGLIIHDGGTSCVGIHFCPWCGAGLDRSGWEAGASQQGQGEWRRSICR